MSAVTEPEGAARASVRVAGLLQVWERPSAGHSLAYLRFGKRILDLVVASLLLLAFGPLMLALAALVRLTSPGPALLQQLRTGLHGRPFRMLKFRTMHVGVDDAALREMNRRELLGDPNPGTSDGVFKLESDLRITAVGRRLRRFSIDELPQLINVIRGEMSMVGPRPSFPWEVEMFTAEQRRRHECLPGITGLWQVSGRNRIPMPAMLALDLAYTQSHSLRLDLWILAQTPRAVLFDRSVR
jgi:lipopolysaccharide/colanic/teichoic acid biosynthesis glycosyltransferase